MPQSKAVVKPSLIETNNAHFSVEDSTYSYYVFENSSEVKSVKKNNFNLYWKSAKLVQLYSLSLIYVPVFHGEVLPPSQWKFGEFGFTCCLRA